MVTNDKGNSSSLNNFEIYIKQCQPIEYPSRLSKRYNAKDILLM